ncbi:MAG: hypothetical protein HYT89_04770 [Candidatus Omnitrophica bacterium]|nr:hypothetical protein [Candidatus Omnitrophota bacterium]
MDIQESWEKALRFTEIIRPRVQPLHAFAVTRVPYVFLSESAVNTGDTVVRKGEVVVEKPSIVLPFNLPRFEGFEFGEEAPFDEESLNTFFLVRGVSFPSFKYNNKTSSVEVFEGGLSKAIKDYSSTLSKAEDVHSGLVIGPEDAWQFSVIIFACSQVSRSAHHDIRRLLDDTQRRGDLS